jgi:hypothetical protein
VGLLADVALVVVPIALLNTLKSDPALRRRILVIFAVTLLLTIAAIAQTIIFVRTPGAVHLVAALVEVRDHISVSRLCQFPDHLMNIRDS